MKVISTSNIKHSNRDKDFDGTNNGKYSKKINDIEDSNNRIERYDEDNANYGVKRNNEANSK